MEKIEVKGFFFLVIFLILMHNNSITQGTSILTLTQGARYDYAVLCTDYCGSKIWDATNLEADLYFYITSIDKIKDDISIYTRYNSTPVIEKPDDSDYGIFSLNETYSYSSRESKTESGKFLWQWSRLETELRCSIPTFFIAHAYSAFENNTFILQRASELEEIEINSQNFFQAFSYHGVWNHSYKIGNLSVMDEASLTSTYDSDSGILLKMAIEMISTQQLIGPISQEINVDAIGSFKISLVLPSNHTTDILPFFLGVFSLIVIVEKQGRSK